jgi:DNA-directed RNA polymerase subunit E'/Rpb7
MFRVHRLEDTIPVAPGTFWADMTNMVAESIDVKFGNRVRGVGRAGGG